MKILKKKLFFLFGNYFFSNWEKSHLNPIGKGAEFLPLRTQKKSLGGHVFQPIKNIWTFLAVLRPMIIYAKLFSNPSVSISHDAMGMSAVCDCAIS